MRHTFKPANIIGVLALGLACLAIPQTARAQTDIPVTNGSFEEPDPTNSVKPLGWFRRGYGEFQPTPNVANPVWEYVTGASDAFDGTDYVCLHAPPAAYGNPVSWELEGLTAGIVNADNRGQGSLIPVVTGGLYEATVYARWTGTATGQLRMRVQHQGTNAPNAPTVTTGGLYDLSTPTNGWVKLSSGPFIARSNFVSPRLYGNLLSGDVVACFDKVEFKLHALPVTVSGVVRDSGGQPMAGVGVGINVPTKNGMADPLGGATTGEDGRFTITFPKVGDNFVAQAWLENRTLSDNVPVNLTGDTVITYNPAITANLLAGVPVIAVSSTQPDGGNPPSNTNDGNVGTRWSTAGGIGGDDAEVPHYVVYDAGQTIDFSTIRSAEVWWENARSGHWQIRVSNTPPDPAMYTPQSGGNNALALQYGTVVYDSGPGAADLSLVDPALNSRFRDVVSQFSPGSGRYIMIALLQQGPFPNHSIFEFKLLVPAISVTGRLVNEGGQPVVGTVMTYPEGNNQTATNDQGQFTILVPATAGAKQYMAHAIEGDTVYTLSNPFSITPETTNVGDIRMNSAPNQVIQEAPTDAYKAAAPADEANDPTRPTSFAVDYDLTTRWSSASITNIDTVITPATPFYYVVDMASPRTINTILIDWETARPAQYRVQVGNDYDFLGRTGGTWQDVKVSAGPPEDTMIYNWGGGDYIDLISFAPTTAQFIRVVMEKRLEPFTNFSIWELQAANLTALPTPLGNARAALRIAGGLEAAPANISALNVVTSGSSATVIDILDAVELAKRGQ